MKTLVPKNMKLPCPKCQDTGCVLCNGRGWVTKGPSRYHYTKQNRPARKRRNPHGLTIGDAKEIRRLYNTECEKIDSIAKLFNVSCQHIRKIINNEVWIEPI